MDELLEQLLAIVIDTIRREETRDDFALAGPAR